MKKWEGENTKAMEQNKLFTTLEQFGVIPVIAIESQELSLPLADALINGGLPVAEITFRTKAAGEVIKMLKKERPQLLLGAGTILSIENLIQAKEYGAEFGVAPGLNPDIVQKAQEIGLPFCPGVVTPTEIEKSLALGITVMKYFPAEAVGGLNMIKAVSAPYGHLGVRFIPTGGVNMKNLPDYLAFKSILAVGGTWIATKEMISAKQWDTITENARAASEVVTKIRGKR
jgi:2-dehydro-3-deoxyphosphogluconate aldolase/(4S)-4-hydroxy-2-oxoglutarate aldolase